MHRVALGIGEPRVAHDGRSNVIARLSKERKRPFRPPGDRRAVVRWRDGLERTHAVSRREPFRKGTVDDAGAAGVRNDVHATRIARRLAPHLLDECIRTRVEVLVRVVRDGGIRSKTLHVIAGLLFDALRQLHECVIVGLLRAVATNEDDERGGLRLPDRDDKRRFVGGPRRLHDRDGHRCDRQLMRPAGRFRRGGRTAAWIRSALVR